MNFKNAAAACIVTAAVATLLAAGNAAQSVSKENYILNPGFEETSAGGKVPGWSKPNW
jgi:hypothetical protein